MSHCYKLSVSDLADRQLVPGTHLIDSGYVVANLLVSAPRDHQIDMVGPVLSSSSRQGREGQGYDVHSFAIDWEAQQACCPQGHHSVKWTPGYSPEGHDVIRIRFDKATCDAGAVRPTCTSSTKYPRQITVKPQALHEAIEAARPPWSLLPSGAGRCLKGGDVLSSMRVADVEHSQRNRGAS